MRSIEWRYFRLPWTTLNPDFKVTPLFDTEYLKNGTRYSFNGIGTYLRILYSVLSLQMILSDLGEMFNDTKHCMVSLWQLSFLFGRVIRILTVCLFEWIGLSIIRSKSRPRWLRWYGKVWYGIMFESESDLLCLTDYMCDKLWRWRTSSVEADDDINWSKIHRLHDSC